MIAGGLLLALVLVVELAALPVAGRVLGAALGRCLPYDEVEVESIARPLTPRLLVGRARDVELTATGLRLGAIRVEQARLLLPEVALPWAVGEPPAARATLELRLREADVEAFLLDRAPLGLRPVVELSPGVASFGVEPLPARVPLAVDVTRGRLQIRPVGDAPGWFERLGLDLSYQLPDDVGLDHLEVRWDAVFAVIRVDAVAGIDGSGGCEGPLGTRASAPAAAVTTGGDLLAGRAGWW